MSRVPRRLINEANIEALIETTYRTALLPASAKKRTLDMPTGPADAHVVVITESSPGWAATKLLGELMAAAKWPKDAGVYYTSVFKYDTSPWKTESDTHRIAAVALMERELSFLTEAAVVVCFGRLSYGPYFRTMPSPAMLMKHPDEVTLQRRQFVCALPTLSGVKTTDPLVQVMKTNIRVAGKFATSTMDPNFWENMGIQPKDKRWGYERRK